MYLEHAAIYTNDLERMRDFYTRYFCGRANQKYISSTTGLQTYFISFHGGSRLELMQKPQVSERNKSVMSYGLNHISFCVGSRERVDELTKILENDGYTIKSMPRQTGDGYYESCILDPDSNEVEIMA